MTLAKKIILLLLCSLLIIMSGCWDKQELSKTAIIIGVGLEATNNSDICLTVETAHRRMGEEVGESIIFSATGKNLAEAQQNLTLLADNELYWGQTALVIFGENLSKRQIDALALNLFADERIASTVDLLYTNGRAYDILHGKFGAADYVSHGLVKALILEEERGGDRYLLTDYIEDLLGEAEAEQQIYVSLTEEGQVILNENANETK